MLIRRENKIIEITIKTGKQIKNPFWDIDFQAIFKCISEKVETILHCFYDGTDENGEHVWKARWRPVKAGEWNCKITTFPVIEDLNIEFNIHIHEDEIHEKGSLRAYPKEKWGLRFDNGEPFFLLGDTMYNLFGAAHCRVDVERVLRHRKAQGINYIRARMQVSPFHPQRENNWQVKNCWPWGGSAQLPDFKQLNVEYFRAVDKVVSLMTDLGMGLEMIFEAWLLEFPFNDRGKFLPEYEELWFKYIISRYTAYPSVYVWCPANEYEFYPGEVKYHTEADRWMKRLAAMIRQYDPYCHPIGVHNWEQKLSLSERFEHIDEIDIYLVQTDWFLELDKNNNDASLCKWLKDQMKHHTMKSEKVAICAEFGYEKAGNLFTVDVHEYMNHHHTRRGQWRAGFSGYSVIHGFNNTWGAHMTVEADSVGAQYLIHYFRFMTEDVKFFEMSPKEELMICASGNEEDGTLPMCISDDDLSVISVYFPTKGQCELELAKPDEYMLYWVNPRTGEKDKPWRCKSNCFETPPSNEGNEIWGDDWVLLLKK
jgi:Protein of unknown function (DUF4038)/Domain of unknown function (DUF5060)